LLATDQEAASVWVPDKMQHRPILGRTLKYSLAVGLLLGTIVIGRTFIKDQDASKNLNVGQTLLEGDVKVANEVLPTDLSVNLLAD